ncbi:MAG TPA: flagellin, partial [Chloroflexota bacterium]|nr:flagellin [Chloroflexota bacterium]
NVSGQTGLFSSGIAKNAVVSVTTSGGGAAQLLTATGLNSDTISGVGTYAGLQITLANPGQLASGNTFSVSQNASLQYQVGANANQTISLRIDSASSQALGVSSLNVLTQQDAQTATSQLDRAIQAVSASRANMGAIINRLTNAMTNDSAAQANALSANSGIEDVNVAQATVQFTRDQILIQAGTSILAQANQASSGMLALLR